ncbi:MAG: AmmeMemoRadiSam system protein A [Micrococcales bacterium]|nr:AmmeMemoRadiSam system protein A [Micrococcales bacterium]
MTEPTRALPDDAGPVLLAAARAAIADALGTSAPPPPPWPDWAGTTLGTFVTLTQDGELRGCIGTLVEHLPLREGLAANAVRAARHDPRFPPLTADELTRTRVEVSVLSAAEPMAVTSQDEALAALRPGVDGLIFAAGGHQATFLPQVWEQLPDPRTFLTHLRRKAGLASDYWGPDVRLSRYTVQAWEEPDPTGDDPS